MTLKLLDDGCSTQYFAEVPEAVDGMKVAIGFLTKDRVVLSEQSMLPLAPVDEKWDLFWFDGSTGEEGQNLPHAYSGHFARCFWNVTGGAGVALVTALATMLNHENNYQFIGLCENDVLLKDGWQRCFELFEHGKADGLEVGAVSARCYEDRILLQCSDSYAICHNLGAGHVIFTRKAAELVLKTFRSAWTTDNRRIFSALSGIDIGKFWAFGQNAQFLTADWHWDAVLAAHGLASLALTPSPVEMIGQEPPLEQQGLKIVAQPALIRENHFAQYRDKLAAVRKGVIDLNIETQFYRNTDDGTWLVFPHQLRILGGSHEGWLIRDLQKVGVLTFESAQNFAQINVQLAGPLFFLVSGGKQGGRIVIEDAESGYKSDPLLPPEGDGQMLQIPVPGGINSRMVTLRMTEGCRFYAIQMREAPQRVQTQLKVENLLG